MAQATSSRFVLGIKIEGVGVDDVTAPTASDRRYRFVTGRNFLDSPSTTDPDELYKDGLLFWPSELGSSIDFISGTVTLSTHTFTLQMTDYLRSTLFRYNHSFVAKHTTTGGINSTTTALTLDKTGIADNTIIYLRREAMQIDSSVGNNYVVVRGVLNTQAVPHGTTSRDNVEVYTTLRVLEARSIELFRVDMDASAYNETTLWRGIVRRVYAKEPQELTIEADSLKGLLSSTKLMRNQWSGKVERWGIAGVEAPPTAREPVRREHRLDAITQYGDKAIFEMDGEGSMIMAARRSRVPPGVTGGVLLDELYHQRGRDGALESFNLSPELAWGQRGADRVGGFIGKKIWEVLSTSRQQPSGTGRDADEMHNLPLASNPAALVLQLLLTYASEKPGEFNLTPQVNHSVYDMGIGNVGAKIRSDYVDIDSIERWGHRVFGDMSKFKPDRGLDCFHLGMGGEDMSALDAIERILHPYGCVLTVGAEGKLKVVQLADALALGITNTIAQSDIIGVPSQDRMMEASIETIQSSYNIWPQFDGDSLEFRDMFNLDQLPDGWGDAPQFEIYQSNEAVCRALLERFIHRFHLPVPLITLETLRTLSYYPGDVVSLTHEHLFKGDGTKGLVDATCLVTSRTEILSDDGHTIKYELLYVGAIYNKVGYIAPSAKVTGYSVNPITGVTTVTVLVNEFTNPADGIGPFRRDCPDDTDSTKPFQAGDVIQLVDQYGTVRDAAETISSVSQDTIFLTNPFSVTPTTTAGQEDIIRVASYDSAVATQKSRWVFVADADNTLGAANDDPFEYTFDEGEG